MSLQDMGEGSIIETRLGDLFYKNEDDTWSAMTVEKYPSPGYASRELYNLGSLEIVREVTKPSPLEVLQVGSVIKYDSGTVATKVRDSMWRVAGKEGLFTETEMLTYYISDVKTIKELS